MRRAIATGGHWRRFQRGGEDLGDIFHLELLLCADSLDAILEHRNAEGAGRRHRISPSVERLLHARVVDALAGLFLHPDTTAAAATTERAVAAARHLGHALLADDVQYAARLIVDIVPATDEARVMVGELAAVEARRQLELASRDQPVNEFGVVHHLEVAAQLRVLVLDRVEAVRAGRHHRLYFVRAPRLHADTAIRGAIGSGCAMLALGWPLVEAITLDRLDVL